VRSGRARPIAARALVVALAVMAAPAAAAAARTPAAVVRASLAPLAGAPYRASFGTAVTTSFSGVTPPELAAQLPALPPVRASARLDVESPRRTRASETVSGVRVAVVIHDGQVFVSSDGRRFKRAVGPLRKRLATVQQDGSAARARSYLDHLSGLRPMGRARRDGVLTTRYRGNLDPGYLRLLLIRAAAGAGLPADIVKAMVTTSRLDSGTVDFFVTAAGRLAGIESAQRTSMDMVPLLRARGTVVPDGVSGLLLVSSTFSMRLGGVGTGIRVRRPAAAGTVSTLAQIS
jgi:hypothetical protein